MTSTRTHVKALLRPILLFILICGVAGFVVPLVPADPPLLVWVIALVAAAAVVYWVLRPVLEWLGTSYTLTNRRLLTRYGILTRYGRDLALDRIHDVFYERGLLDRVLGCGTLVVTTAGGGRDEMVLPDVPSVESLQLSLTELLDGGGYDGAEDDDAPVRPDRRRWR